MRVFVLSLLALLLSATGLWSQEKDTTRHKEELLLGSELFHKTDEERRQMVLRPRFRYINTTEKTSLLKIGYRPSYAKYLNLDRVEDFGGNIAVSYERMIKGTQFSWNVETLIPTRPVVPYGFDYKEVDEGAFGGLIEGQWINSGKFYLHAFRVHATLRYYYNMKARIKAEASGKNLYSEYVFFRFRDIAAYTHTTKLEFNRQANLLLHKSGKRWLVQPTYISTGWGIQRPFLGKVLLDANVEIGARLHSAFSAEFVHQDFTVDFNLFIGLGL